MQQINRHNYWDNPSNTSSISWLQIFDQINLPPMHWISPPVQQTKAHQESDSKYLNLISHTSWTFRSLKITVVIISHKVSKPHYQLLCHSQPKYYQMKASACFDPNFICITYRTLIRYYLLICKS